MFMLSKMSSTLSITRAIHHPRILLKPHFLRPRMPSRQERSCLYSILQAFSAPLINDISTDLTDPPNFTSVSRGRLPESYKAKIAEGYPDLKPLQVEGKREEVFQTAVVVAKAQPRWEVTLEDKEGGTIEGVATTAILQFKDDFVIRLRQESKENVTTVDMRSKSRMGQGDLGANAARICSYFEALQAKL